MAVESLVDYGPGLARPEGQALGFVDTKEQFDAVVWALNAEGFAGSNMVTLYGEDGIKTLKRQQKTFNFGDGEDAFMEFAFKEMRAGHYALGVEVRDRADALLAISLSEPLGAHSFSYFGTWENERLTR